MFAKRKMDLKQLCFALLCFCGFVGIFYSLMRSASFNLTGRPYLAVNGVVALTGFLSISQQRLNLKTIHNRHRVDAKRGNLSSVSQQRLLKTHLITVTTASNDDSWEYLESFTIARPSNGKLRRRMKNTEELDEKFLRNDERSIERIVDGLEKDTEDEISKIYLKEGMPKKRFPNVLIVGVKKGGTRALLEMIKLHPQVCACGPEIHYFDRYYDKGLQWYRDRMPICYENELTVEKTPSYFVTTGVERAIFEYSKNISKDLNRTLKLIVIVRDPTRRAISDFTQTRGHHNFRSGLTKTFEDLAITRTSLGDGNYNEHLNTRWGAIKIGAYSKHLKRWLRYFSLKQIHFVSGEILIKQPYEELRKVEQFLQLPAYIKPEHFVYNETKGFYCFDRRIRNANLNVTNATPMKCLGSTKGRTHVLITNTTEKLMRDYYKPFNEELYNLIGRDFAWP